MSTPSKTVLDINNPEVKYLMSELLKVAYQNGPNALHDPVVIWKSMTGPKPPLDTVMPLLEYMERYEFVEVDGTSGFGKFCDFKLTYKSKKIYEDGMKPPAEPRNPVGY
jgi:hypothetical protein